MNKQPQLSRDSRGAIAVLALGALGLAGFAGLWAAAALLIANPVQLPAPPSVLSAYRELLLDGSLMTDMAASMKRVFVGFLIAASLATPLALILAYSWTLRCMFLPVVTLIRPVPPIAWIPLAILWLGIGDPPSYFITAIAAFFPIFLNSYAGGAALLDEHVNAARSLGANSRSILLNVMLPSALPMIATGWRIGLGQAWMAVVTAELIAARSGLGYMIQINRINLETARVLVGMTLIGLLGSVMVGALGVIEHKFIIPWRQVR
jgi:ABC-type nitrate/sulfonate/bicarbonate transport system permease component